MWRPWRVEIPVGELLRPRMIDWDQSIALDGPAVWRTCWRLLGNHADAEEAFQETFLAAFELSKRQTLLTPRAVLQHLATARSIDRLRSRQRRKKRHELAPTEVLDQAPAEDVLPHQCAQSAELSVALRKALAAIPPKQAEAFALHAIEGWSYQQISEQMAITIDHVGVLIHRARAKLQRLLSRFGQGKDLRRVTASAEAAASPPVTTGDTESIRLEAETLVPDVEPEAVRPTDDRTSTRRAWRGPGRKGTATSGQSGGDTDRHQASRETARLPN